MTTASKFILAILIAAGVVVAGLAWHNHESASPVNPSPSASSVAKTSPSPSGVAVKVYFSKHPQSDNDPSATFAVSRLSSDPGVGKFAVSQLLSGPTSAETQAGFFTPGLAMSGNSTCGGDFSLNIAGSTATLQFCRTTALKGVVADGQLQSELTDTLKQFSGVTKVIILNQASHCLFDASGQDLCKK